MNGFILRICLLALSLVLAASQNKPPPGPNYKPPPVTPPGLKGPPGPNYKPPPVTPPGLKGPPGPNYKPPKGGAAPAAAAGGGGGAAAFGGGGGFNIVKPAAPAAASGPPVAMRVHLYYSTYLYFKRPNWLEYIVRQLKRTMEDGLNDYTERTLIFLNVDTHANRTQVFEAVAEVSEVVYIIFPNAEIIMSMKNKHEFFPMRKMWGEAAKMSVPMAKESVFLYFFSKGMTHGQMDLAYSPRGEELYNKTVKPWRKVVDVFHKCKKVEKAGYLVSNVGHLFEEFAWVRPEYLRKLEAPPADVEQHYYETWMARKDNRMRWNSLRLAGIQTYDPSPPNFVGPVGGWSMCNPSIPVGFGALHTEVDVLCAANPPNIMNADISMLSEATQTMIKQIRAKQAPFNPTTLPFINSLC